MHQQNGRKEARTNKGVINDPKMKDIKGYKYNKSKFVVSEKMASGLRLANVYICHGPQC